MNIKICGKNINIYIIGFTGSGKSSIGYLLSKKINFKFIDSDNYIKKLYNTNIKQIFQLYGENVFRNIEKKFFISLKNKYHYIVSCGGGIVNINNIKNILHFNNKIIIIYLYASFKTIYQRLLNDFKNKKNFINHRPLIINFYNNKINYKKLKKLFYKRKILYKKLSHYIINTNKISKKNVCKKILKIINI